MGADGHINIYHLDRMKKIIPDPIGYRYRIFGQWLLVNYFGDYPPGYDTPPCINCSDMDCEKPECIALRERAEKCRITEWEVWT